MIAAPRKQTRHNYIPREIDRWLNVHFGDQSFNGRVFIGHRKHGGGVYTMTARSLSELRPYVMMVHASQRLDYYITANTVSGVNRTVDGLFGLQNIVIDIDCHEMDKQSAAPFLIQKFIWRCERDLWSATELPRPNSIVYTGRGVQLWWAIEPCHASCRFYYDKIKTGLIDRFELLLNEYEEDLEGLQIDHAASNNPVGYFRLPGTYNTTAKRYGTFEVLSEKRYNTHELAGYITPLPRTERRTEAPKPSQSVPMQECDIIVLHNNYSTGANRVMQLIKLRNLRNNEVGAETRNNLCFSVYNALRMSYNHDEAMERVRAYNEGFKRPMTERELEHTICSAKRKGGYKYTNESLIELLDITPQEQDIIGLHPFNGTYKPWSHAKPNATRDAVRKARKDDRNDKIIALHHKGVSQAQTARILGISRNTVARVLKEWSAQKDLEIAQENLLNYGSIYDCLLVSDGGGSGLPSVSDSSEPTPVGFVVLPSGGRSGPS